MDNSVCGFSICGFPTLFSTFPFASLKNICEAKKSCIKPSSQKWSRGCNSFVENCNESNLNGKQKPVAAHVNEGGGVRGMGMLPGTGVHRQKSILLSRGMKYVPSGRKFRFLGALAEIPQSVYDESYAHGTTTKDH